MPTGVRLMVVRPHPDDEASATGGILARYGALGVPTAVVTCTNGEEGEVLDPDHVKCFPVTERAFFAAGDPAQYPDAGPPWTPARLYSIVSVRSNWNKIARMLIEAGFEESWLTRRRRYNRRWGIAKKDATCAIHVSADVE